MFKKNLISLIAIIICVCVIGSLVSVFADPVPPLNIDPTGGSGFLEDTTAPPETTTPPTTEVITTRPPTTEDEDEEEVTEEDEDEEEEDEEETTDETTQEDDSFKVYLELNGGKIEGFPLEKGKTFLTTDMPAPGLVPIPGTEPTKAGYLFDGWYSDEDFTKVWNPTSSFAFEEMTIYAKWIRDPAAILYNITVVAGKGGKITVRPQKAAVGETVLIMIQPEEGMRLKKGSLLINGEPSDILSFEMPAGDVVVEAEFEVTPVEAKKEDNSTVIVACVAAVIIIAIVVFFIINKRRNAIIVPEFDEDGAIIIEDNEEVWIDESIVVESGFREGKKASDINPPKIEDFENLPAFYDSDKE